MATVDSLDIQVEGSVKKANQAIDALIGKLGKLADALKIDTSSLKNIGNQVNLGGMSKSLDTVKEKAKEVEKTISESVQKASNSLNSLTEKYKDLGKGFQFFGDERQIQRAINQYSNALEKAKLKKEELESSGKVEGQNYEYAIRDLMKYSNIVDSLNSKLNGMSDLSISVPEIHIASPEMQRSLDEIVDDLDRYMETLHRASGDYMPFAEAERSIEELTERFPDAIEEIKFFKSELEDLSSQRIEIEVPEISEQVKTILKDMSDQEQHEWFKNLPSVKAQLEQVNNYVEDLTRNTREFTGEWNGIKIPDYLKGNSGITEIVDTESLDLAEKKIEELQKRFQEAGMNFAFEGNADELESEIKRVYAQLNKLFEREDKAISLGNVNTKSFESLQYDIAEATNKLDILRNYKTDLLNTNLEESAQRAKEFSESLDKLEIPEIKEGNLEKLQKMLEKAEIDLDKFRKKLQNDITMGKVTENFNDKGYVGALRNIREKEKAIDALKEKINKISSEIKQESAAAFQDKLSKLKVPEIKTNSLKQLEKELQKAESDLDKFKTKLQNDISMGRIKADFGDKGYQKAAEQIALTEKRIEAIKEKMKTADSEAGKTGGYKNLSQSMSGLSAVGDRLGSAFSKIVSHTKRLAANIQKLAGSGLKGLANGFKNLASTTAKLSKSLISGVGNGFRNIASNVVKLSKSMISIQKANKNTDKTLKDGIATILKYTLSIRSLFMLIRKMKDAFKEGLDNIVQYSSEVNHSVSLMTSSLFSLKNSLAVAFSPIVSVIEPYITRLINLLTDAFNAIGRFFSALTGKNIAIQAKKVYKDYAESISGVADAAKEAAKAIGTIGIDELNILSEKKETQESTPDDMFEEVQIEGGILDWAEKIRETFLNQDWEGLGEEVGKLLNKGFQKIYDAINWGNVGDKITGFIDAFTTTFNSLIDSMDWDLLGRTVGAGINTLANTFNQLLEKINFENIGRKLSKALRGMLDEVDWKNLGNLIGNYFMLAWRTAEGFIKDMWRLDPDTLLSGWAELGIAIGNIINGIFEKIDFARIAKVITDGLRGILETATYALNTIDFKAISANINRGLEALYNGIKWETIGAQITAFTAAVSKAFNGLLTLDFEMIGRIIGAGITDIVRAFNQLTGEGGIDFELLGSKIADGLRGLFTEIPWEEFGNALGNGFMVAWRILDGFVSNMSQKNGAGLTGWQQLGISFAQGLYGIFEKIDFGKIGTIIANIFNGIFESLRSFVDEMERGGKWKLIADNISRGLNNAISGIKPVEAAQALGKFVTDLLQTMLDVAQSTPWQELGQKIGQFLTNIPWGEILRNVFDIVTTVLGGLFIGLISEISSHFGEVGSALADGFNYAFERLREFTASVPWDSIAANIYIGLNNMIRGINWSEVGATLSNFVMKLLDVFWQVAQNTDWEGFGRGVGEFLSNIDWMAIIGKVFDILWNVFSRFISELFDTKAGKVVLAIGAGMLTIEGLFKGLKVIAAASSMFNSIRTIFSAFSLLFSPTGLIIGAIVGAAVLIITNWDKIGETASNLWNNVLVPLGNFLKDVFVGIWNDLLSPAINYLANEVLPKLLETLKNLWNNVLVPLGNFVSSVFAPVFEIVSEVLTNLWKNVIVPVAEALGGVLSSALEAVWALLNDLVIPVLFAVIDVLQNLWDNFLKPIVEWVGDTLGPVLEGAFSAIGDGLSFMMDILSGLVSFLSGVISGCGEVLSGLIGTIGEILDNLGTALSGIIDFITGVFTGDWEKAWNGVVNIFKGIFNLIPTIVEGVINFVVGAINTIIGGINKATKLVKLPSIPLIPKVTLPRFESGGFPEDGLFFANRNELVGEFSNGQTAVANNAQIVDGIKYGVREAVAEVLAPYLADIAQNTRETADKNMSVRIGDRDIYDANKRAASRVGYSFTS